MFKMSGKLSRLYKKGMSLILKISYVTKITWHKCRFNRARIDSI